VPVLLEANNRMETMLKALLLLLMNLASRSIALTAAVVMAGMVMAQNLVPNPGFESPVTCIGVPWSNTLELAAPWFSPNLATPDLYTTELTSECGNEMTVEDPNDIGLYRVPWDGQRYVGLYLLLGIDGSTKEYSSARLNSDLIPGDSYVIRMRYSVSTAFRFAVERFGVYFSPDSLAQDDPGLLNVQPQILFSGDPFLDVVDGWALVEGQFVANGTERFMTIGSFDASSDMDVLEISGSSFLSAYYLLDKIELVNTELENGIRSELWLRQSVSGDLILDWQGGELAHAMDVWDASGRWLQHEGFAPSGTPLAFSSSLPSGVYVVRLELDGKVIVAKWVKE